MAITSVGTETGVADSIGSTVISVSRPSGSASGDVAIAIACVDDSDSVGLPSGFTELHDEAFGGGDARLKVGYKVMGGSEPSSYDFSKDSNELGVACITVFRGVNNTSPIDAFPSYDLGSSALPTAPSTTTTTANAAVIATYGHEHGDGTTSSVSPAGATLLATAGTNATVGAAFGVAWLDAASVGSYGPFEFTVGDSDTWGAISFSLMDENETPPPKTGEGDLAADGAVLDGQGSAFSTITGSGAAEADSVDVGGVGDSISQVSGDGALAAVIAELTGSADRVLFGQGGVAAESATVDGAGSRVITAAEGPAAEVAAVDGAAVRIVTGSGPLTPGPAVIDGTAFRGGDNQGTLVAQLAQVAAAVGITRRVSAALVLAPVNVDSTSEIGWKTVVALDAGSAIVVGDAQVFTGHVATGGLASGQAAVGAVTQRGVTGSGALQAEPGEVYLVTWLTQDPSAGDWQNYSGGHWS